jgi:hypothetical protein
MGIHPWLIAGLATIDLVIIISLYFQMRRFPRLDRRGFLNTGAGLTGFVVHAFLFADGAFLILQLATIAAIFGICWLQHLGRLSKPKVKVAK